MKKLKAKRVMLDISQQELAKRLGVSPTWVGEIENRKKVSPKMEKRIIEELNKIEIEKYGIGIPTLS